MILANGCPKSGTHALMAWLESLGLKRAPGIVKSANVENGPDMTYAPHHFIHAHVPYGHDVSRFSGVVTVIRDPRDVIISYSRWNKDGISAVSAINNFFGKDFCDVYCSYLMWIGNCTVARYEDLVTNGKVVSVGSNTYTGKVSNWREMSDDALLDAFDKNGIHELARKAGYE